MIDMSNRLMLFCAWKLGKTSKEISTYNENLKVQWRCLWCNGYRRRKWTRRHKFKSWTRLITFNIALIPLWKVWIQLFSFQLWLNSNAYWVLQSWWDNLSRRRKTLNWNLLNSELESPLKNWSCVISCTCGGVGKCKRWTRFPTSGHKKKTL